MTCSSTHSCILSGPISGTYQLTGGTGLFAGASGSGTFRTQNHLFFGRDAQGACLGPASGPPVFFTQVARQTGQLTVS